MLIHAPCVIGPRLLPAVQIGGAWVSIEYAKRAGREGRQRYQWYVDLPKIGKQRARSYTGDDLQSGCGGGSLQSGLESLLSFMSACAESVRYTARDGSKGENADLFPEGLHSWLVSNSDELAMLACELEESETPIIEE